MFILVDGRNELTEEFSIRRKGCQVAVFQPAEPLLRSDPKASVMAGVERGSELRGKTFSESVVPGSRVLQFFPRPRIFLDTEL